MRLDHIILPKRMHIEVYKARRDTLRSEKTLGESATEPLVLLGLLLGEPQKRFFLSAHAPPRHANFNRHSFMKHAKGFAIKNPVAKKSILSKFGV